MKHEKESIAKWNVSRCDVVNGMIKRDWKGERKKWDRRKIKYRNKLIVKWNGWRYDVANDTIEIEKMKERNEIEEMRSMGRK